MKTKERKLQLRLSAELMLVGFVWKRYDMYLMQNDTEYLLKTTGTFTRNASSSFRPSVYHLTLRLHCLATCPLLFRLRLSNEITKFPTW